MLPYPSPDTLLCACCADPGLCLFPGACLPCNRGFYQPLAGQQQCLPCNRGFYTNFTGSPLCNTCPTGSFNISLVETVAQVVQQVSFPRSTAPLHVHHVHREVSAIPLVVASVRCVLEEQKLCSLPQGAAHCVGQTLCQICGSGFYQVNWGRENCDLCPENHYCPSPDVNPIKCPSDAFCPEGSLSPGYCMETFFRKEGDTCELAPVTLALLVIGGGVAVLFIILMVLRRRRDIDGELTVARAPLLSKERPQGRYYGVPCDAEPVYAGW
ncbi:hypothetical protein F7725_008026 [Dissostichus mawsoni]|uniref:Tyrosine-protein kinase ephrin type A/B receptor-like domain-containing protein n=1 Tax=Dissostichus mawsoni TaxID=36200 RepID=A0A7J5Y6W2_DISMA|nr:hypothetical protein F7725_008026 [Dissostichus mawsoni]